MMTKRRLVRRQIIWVSIAIGPQLLSAAITPFKIVAFFNCLLVASFLLIPCNCPLFGGGSKYFWVRQSVFSVATVIGLLFVFLK